MQGILKKTATLLSIVLASAALAYSAQSPTATALPTADSSWHKISEDDGVVAYSKDVPHSDIVAFRGETIIDAPIAKVANVLIDTSRKKEWVYKIVEAKDVREISQLERIEYNHTSSGFFLVRDRDFVFRAKCELDRAKGQAVFTLKSVDDPAAPKSGCVRGQLDFGRYILTQLDNGKKTHVVVEIHADPKGNVPKWLVNLFQKSWPAKTLNGIREQCGKPDIKEHEGIKAFFAQADTAEPASTVKPTATAGSPGGLK